jgi:hypothetical protein
MEQIARAYKARLRPRMSKDARAALERERKRQMRLAMEEYKAAKTSVQARPGKRTVISKRKKIVPRVVKPRRSTSSFPIGGVAQRVSAVKTPTIPPAPDTPTWRYRDDDGAPIHPWQVMTHDAEGRPLYDDDDDADLDDAWGFDEDYTYDDFEADWGGYDHQDTGYADENA